MMELLKCYQNPSTGPHRVNDSWVIFEGGIDDILIGQVGGEKVDQFFLCSQPP